MILESFRDGSQEFGIWRIVKNWDFLTAALFSVIVGVVGSWGCTFHQALCFTIYNEPFVRLGTHFAISLTAFILAGLAIIISFTDDEFLVELKELGIYSNIMFVFQFNLYLAGAAAATGILVATVFKSELAFLLFLLAFVYMLLSIAEMVDLIVQYGNQRANYEQHRNAGE